MEDAPSEVSEVYSDVFEQEISEQSAHDDASDIISVRSAMGLSRSQEGLSDQDYQTEEAYIQGKRLAIYTCGINANCKHAKNLIIASCMQVQLRHTLHLCPQMQTLIASLAAYEVRVSSILVRSQIGNVRSNAPTCKVQLPQQCLYWFAYSLHLTSPRDWHSLKRKFYTKNSQCAKQLWCR